MGVYEGGFECPPGTGVGCKSISDVNQMVNDGELPQKPLPDLPQTHCEKCGSNLEPQQNDFEHPEGEHPEGEHPKDEHSKKPHIWYSSWALEEA